VSPSKAPKKHQINRLILIPLEYIFWIFWTNSNYVPSEEGTSPRRYWWHLDKICAQLVIYVFIRTSKQLVLSNNSILSILIYSLSLMEKWIILFSTLLSIATMNNVINFINEWFIEVNIFPGKILYYSLMTYFWNFANKLASLFKNN